MILCVCPNPSLDKFIWLNDVVAGKVNRINKTRSYAGGKGVHVALGIAELGEECALLGFWGGETGRMIKGVCYEKGISCYGPEIDQPNRTCLTFRCGTDWEGTELLEAGPFINEDAIDLFYLEFAKLLNTTSIVCMSGSWPPASRPIDYTRFIVAAKEKGIKTFVDCSGKSLVNTLAVNPHGVHINNHEGLEIYKESSPIKIAEAVLKSSDLAAITCGADGLYLSGKTQGIVHASCELKKIISAVGCGDSLMAGLVTASSRNLNLVDTAILAVACGSANCLREELGMFHHSDVIELISRVRISKIDNDRINGLK